MIFLGKMVVQGGVSRMNCAKAPEGIYMISILNPQTQVSPNE